MGVAMSIVEERVLEFFTTELRSAMRTVGGRLEEQMETLCELRSEFELQSDLKSQMLDLKADVTGLQVALSQMARSHLTPVKLGHLDNGDKGVSGSVVTRSLSLDDADALWTSARLSQSSRDLSSVTEDRRLSRKDFRSDPLSQSQSDSPWLSYPAPMSPDTTPRADVSQQAFKPTTQAPKGLSATYSQAEPSRPLRKISPRRLPSSTIGASRGAPGSTASCSILPLTVPTGSSALVRPTSPQGPCRQRLQPNQASSNGHQGNRSNSPHIQQHSSPPKPRPTWTPQPRAFRVARTQSSPLLPRAGNSVELPRRIPNVPGAPPPQVVGIR